MVRQSIAITDAQGDLVQALDAQLPIYSLTKTFIASALLATGVDTKQPVATWIDRQIFPRGADVSLAQLLNHTSGLSDYGRLPAYRAAIEAQQPPWSDAVFAAHTLQKPLLFEPGHGWSYSNPGYWLLNQVLQRQTGLSFARALQQQIFEPLDLTSVRVVQQQFADDLPWYPAEWVWHGLLTATARDVVCFMRSDLVKPLLNGLVKVPVQHPLWANPHQSFGLMVEPGIRFGNNGDGPGYSASCFHFMQSGITGCVLTQTNVEGQAMQMLLNEVAAIG